MEGLSLLGVEVTIPRAGANYTDAKTVLAVQAALVKRGYDLGSSGPKKDGVDGILGSKTKAAVKKLQTTLGVEPSGKIDEGVIMALGVTPGVLPPGVSLQAAAAVHAEAALEAATAAEHATTPGTVELAAEQTLAITPAAPPALRQAAEQALTKAKAAKTHEEVAAAAAAVKQVANDVRAEVGPSWWSLPAWEGGPARWKAGAGIGGALALTIGTAVALAKRTAKKVARRVVGG